jgi:hypothetical protein
MRCHRTPLNHTANSVIKKNTVARLNWNRRWTERYPRYDTVSASDPMNYALHCERGAQP